MANPPRKPNSLAQVWGSMVEIAERLVALEKRQLRMRIGPAYRATAEQVAGAYWREMQIGDQTVRLLVLDDDAEHGNG